ncbi:uncharacterized protein K460DRAFT_275609 [Cucurbitaria berberidis CBS 394.84]|uniref:Uncharacterized protein n=1 Tax=Cucurbitaria berberidis CBS 394.84 TaxID=1168544 RepID=A0A9P4GP66_9PLEO|nr:uncharacterized protein K460DRAFT_275609 [Cucurbitaria berberidis CBS 394.84]KAF1848787.1 hypothetical protein K460DRAFT_275609 [Cucurbitaria berberidis CBS 394.84]
MTTPISTTEYVGPQKPFALSKKSPTRPKRLLASLFEFLVHIPSYFGRIGTRCVHLWVPLWRKSWTAETCSCIFAFLSLLGLIATLLAHQDKPLPKWPQLVSINSIVSLFSLLMRAGVGMALAEGISQSKWQWFRKARRLNDMERFDSASRGAWGSIMLLINLSPRRPYWIAALGAFVTVMASLTGFSSQQLVQFSDCLQPDRAAAVGVAKTNSYLRSGRRKGPITNDVFAPMAAGIEIGIIQPVEDRTSVLSHGCTTGNCTFPSTNGASFSSVGISYACEDVTSLVREIPTNETWSDRSTNTSGRAFWANLTSPVGYNSSEIGLLIGASPWLLATGSHDGSGMLSIVQMIFRRSAKDFSYTAINCSIFPSLNTYEVVIKNTVMEEKLLESIPIGYNLVPVVTDKANNEWDIPWKRATSYTLRNGIREVCNRQDTPGSSLGQVASANVDDSPMSPDLADVEKKLWYYPEDCIWSFGLAAASGTGEYLKGIFNKQQLYWNQAGAGNSGSIHLRKLFLESNMTMDTTNEFMGNLTTAMTAVVRAYGLNGSAEHVNGTMWYTTTCMQIRWPWIAFPAIMIGLSAIFLVLVQIESRGVESERLWKSSILATLFCDVENQEMDEAKPVGRHSMEDIAKSTSVSLEMNSQTLKLVAR